MNGASRWKARTSHGANSRCVDARYFVPHPETDWLRGTVQESNTDNEEAYVQRIEEICSMEHIDTIFPSSDAEVYIFSKNKSRFTRQGILCVVQEYEKLKVLLDKYETIQAARRAEFPCPETIIPDSAEDIAAFASRTGPPWIIKPRCTFGGRELVISSNLPLRREIAAGAVGDGREPLVQDVHPGRIRASDTSSRIAMCGSSFMWTEPSKNMQRLFRDAIASFTLRRASLSSRIEGYTEIGSWGGFTIQVKRTRVTAFPS